MWDKFEIESSNVHGDIRHLEMTADRGKSHGEVHGDIRHLETKLGDLPIDRIVHGDIRHLEKYGTLI